MPLRPAILLPAVALALLSGCIVEGRAYRGAYYPPQPVVSSYDATYGYTTAYAPNTVYYSGGYYGGTYYRPGYYSPSAPFISVQSAPNAYVAPSYGGSYVQPAQPAYGGGAYVAPAQPAYGGGGYVAPAQPAYGGGGYVQPAQPAYGRPAYVAPAQPAGGGYVQPAQPAGGGGGYVAPAQPAGGGGVVAPRAGVPQ